jgi:glutathione S-transferase
MKLYVEREPAPNPRRVAIFLREKGLEIQSVRVDLRASEHKTPAHLARNSLGQLPVLELDDGRTICESVSICRYLEGLYPDPPLFGGELMQQALIDMWIRRVEFNLMVPIGLFWRHAHPMTAHLVDQHRVFGESNRRRFESAINWLDRELSRGGPFIAGDQFTMGDIVAITTIDFAVLIGLEVPPSCAAVMAWRENVGQRPSVVTAPDVLQRFGDRR